MNCVREHDGMKGKHSTELHERWCNVVVLGASCETRPVGSSEYLAGDSLTGCVCCIPRLGMGK